MLISKIEDYHRLLERLHSGHNLMVYDLETTGLNPFADAHLIGVAIAVPDLTSGDGGESYYIPFRHKPGPNLPLAELYKLAPLLADPGRVLMGFNVKFDVHFTEAERIAVHNQLIDVMLGAHLANENEMSFSLKRLGTKYVDHHASTEDRQLIARLEQRGLGKADMFKLSPEEVAPYAETDVKLTWALAKFYSDNLEKQGINALWPELNRYLEAVIAMERRGVLINVDACRRRLAEAEEKQEQLKKEMCRIVGRKFNPASVPQLRNILGQRATDRAALSRSKHPIAQLILEYRAWAKAAGTFYRALLDKMDDSYRVHPSFNLIGTVSGRLSCTEPNLQALPKGGDGVYKVRELIVAPPGYTLMSWDLSQAELRLLAHYSQDTFLLDAFKERKDIHGETAAALGIPRDFAKRINFGAIYGIGPDRLAGILGVDRGTAADYLNRYHRNLPGVYRLHQKVVRIAERDRKIPMWTGRLRHYRDADEAHKAMSNLIQGGVAEMMRVIMTKLHGIMRGTGARQVLQIHDEILFEIPEGQHNAVDWAVTIKEAMEDFNFSVPIVAEGRIGYSWGADVMRPIEYDLAGVPVIPNIAGGRT